MDRRTSPPLSADESPSLKVVPQLAAAAMNAVSDHVALLDRDGTIIAVNTAWRQFARENGGTTESAVSVGANYLSVCRRAIADQSSDAAAARDGIEAVLSGRGQSFAMDYGCHAPGEQRWFRMTATPLEAAQGGAVVVHTNITAYKRLELALDDRLHFDRLLAEISQDFVNLPAGSVDTMIERWQRRIVQFFDLDRCTLFQIGEDDAVSVTHAYAAPGIPAMPKIVVDDPLPWYTERLRRGEVVCLASMADFPPEAARDRAFATAQGIKSSITFPLEVGGKRLGALAFGVFRDARDWTPEVRRRLGLIKEVLANALARKQREADLHAALAGTRALKDRLEAENLYLREEVQEAGEFVGIVGDSAALRQVLTRVAQVAPTDAAVLLTGETGTGKELVARAIHARSPRKDRPLITVNCAALPPSLIESELFGHEKGAFTGALARKLGRFELADGGTLFLDEIGELAPETQTTLLRVLQEGTFERVGSSRTIRVNVRVIAASNRDLAEAVRRGQFRSDLYYRLSVFPIRLPPLRDRREDIPLLVWHLITQKQRRMGRRIATVPRNVMAALQAYDWPGNVRELENVVERALIVSAGPALALDEAFALPMLAGKGDASSQRLQDMERAHLLSVLQACEWRIRGRGNAAERLGLHPSTLYFRMKKLGITRPDS